MSNAAAGTDKKKQFLSLQGLLRALFRTWTWLWDALRLLTVKASQNSGLASSRARFLTCATVIFNVKRCGRDRQKRDDFCRFRAYFGPYFAPGLGFETHLDFWPSRLPKTQPPKQRNSMAWRAEGAHFLTCAGVIFNVTHCGRNRWPGELKSPFSDLCWRIFNVKRCEKVFPYWSFSGRAPPCRQGSADIGWMIRVIEKSWKFLEFFED